MGGFQLPRQERGAGAQAEQLRTWFRSSSHRATILEDHDFTINMIFVPNVYKDYIAAATESIMACCATPASDVRCAVQLFFESPVIRAAYGDFKAQCEYPGFVNFLESQLIHALASLAETFYHLETLALRVSWQSATMAIPGNDKLKQIALEYIVRIEIWRREGLADGRLWTFGTSRSRYQFLASTLVQLWFMDKEACFCFRQVQTNSRDWDALWDSWAEDCIKSDMAVCAARPKTAWAGGPQSSSTDGEADENVSFGVGWRLKGWLERT